MDKVYIVFHKSVESGSEDCFEVKRVFKEKRSADLFCDRLNSSINNEENKEIGIEEKYWVEEHEVTL